MYALLVAAVVGDPESSARLAASPARTVSAGPTLGRGTSRCEKRHGKNGADERANEADLHRIPPWGGWQPPIVQASRHTFTSLSLCLTRVFRPAMTPPSTGEGTAI